MSFFTKEFHDLISSSSAAALGIEKELRTPPALVDVDDFGAIETFQVAVDTLQEKFPALSRLCIEDQSEQLWEELLSRFDYVHAGSLLVKLISPRLYHIDIEMLWPDDASDHYDEAELAYEQSEARDEAAIEAADEAARLEQVEYECGFADAVVAKVKYSGARAASRRFENMAIRRDLSEKRAKKRRARGVKPRNVLAQETRAIAVDRAARVAAAF